MRTRMPKKVISGLAIGCLLLSLGGLVLAKDAKPEVDGKQESALQTCRPNHADMEQRFSTNLTALVEKGTITQEQADKILSFFREKGAQHRADRENLKNTKPAERPDKFQQPPKDRPDMAKELSSVAGLSEEQTNAVLEALRPPHMEQKMIQHMADKLSQLVDQSSITQEQSNKILAFFKEKQVQRKADFEKTRNMNPDERKAYFEQNRNTRPDLAAELTAAADLSAEQAKVVAEALRPEHGPKPGPRCSAEQK